MLSAASILIPGFGTMTERQHLSIDIAATNGVICKIEIAVVVVVARSYLGRKIALLRA